MAQRLRWLSLGCPVSRVLKANTLRLRIEGVTERVVSMFWALGFEGFGIRSGLALRMSGCGFQIGRVRLWMAAAMYRWSLPVELRANVW